LNGGFGGEHIGGEFGGGHSSTGLVGGHMGDGVGGIHTGRIGGNHFGGGFMDRRFIGTDQPIENHLGALERVHPEVTIFDLLGIIASCAKGTQHACSARALSWSIRRAAKPIL
jgi:hypothetical protein